MANQVIENEVLENRYESILTTALDMNSYITVDTQLTQEPGMIKNVNVYSVTGNVQDLAMGVGNNTEIETVVTPTPYEVGVTQGRFSAFDEQVMQDPNVLDVGLRGLAETMVNDLTAKAFAELGKATLTVAYDDEGVGITFNSVVDALALLNTEDEAGYFMLVNPATVAQLRKELKDDLKYASDFVRSGYIGSVAGVPVIVSKAVPTEAGFLASNAAVTAFVKKGVESEQERDANTRKTTYYLRKVALVALTDATKVVEFVPDV